MTAAAALAFGHRPGRWLDESQHYWLLISSALSLVLVISLLLEEKPDRLLVWMPFLATSTALALVCLAITQVRRRKQQV